MEERLHSHYESLQRVIGFVRLADYKAGPIAVLQIALAGALGTRLDRLLPIGQQADWGIEQIAITVMLAGYAVFMLGAIAVASWVYVPRNPRTESKSLLYFEDIAAMSCERFTERAARLAPEEIERQLLDQIYRVSGVVSVKMRLVRWALILSAPAILLWIVLLVCGSIQPEAPTMVPLP